MFNSDALKQASMNFDLDKTAVIVVDMQNCFAHEDGVLYAPPSGEVIPKIKEFVNTTRDDGATVIYTRDTHTKNQFDSEFDHYNEFERWGVHALEGSWGHEIVDNLPVKDTDTVIDKSTYDAFHNTNLDTILTEQDIETVLVCGTLANVCVLHTASSAALHDYDTFVVEDLVGYIEDDDKSYALDHVEWLFGDTVQSYSVI